MFIHNFSVYDVVNKSISIGIAIVIIAVIIGVYSISSDDNSVDESILISENQDDLQPKKYAQSLSESLGIKAP
jgi:hypothetical protein